LNPILKQHTMLQITDGARTEFIRREYSSRSALDRLLADMERRAAPYCERADLLTEAIAEYEANFGGSPAIEMVIVRGLTLVYYFRWDCDMPGVQPTSMACGAGDTFWTMVQRDRSKARPGLATKPARH